MKAHGQNWHSTHADFTHDSFKMGINGKKLVFCKDTITVRLSNCKLSFDTVI